MKTQNLTYLYSSYVETIVYVIEFIIIFILEE